MTNTETHVIPDDPEALARYGLSARSAIRAWRDFLAQEAALNHPVSNTVAVWMRAADLLDKQGHDTRAQAMRDAPDKHAQGVDVGGRRPATPGQPHQVKRKDFSVYGLGSENLELLNQAAKDRAVSRNELVKSLLLEGLRQLGCDPKDPTDVDVEVPDN